MQCLALLVLLAVLTSCAHHHLKVLRDYPDPDPSPCKGGSTEPNPDRPIVCIDDRDMNDVKVMPEKVVAKRNAVIDWFTVTGKGSVSIIFRDESPVRHLVCGQNKAFCQAVIDKGAPAPRDYYYFLTVTRDGRKKSIDPTVQVDPGIVVQWLE